MANKDIIQELSDLESSLADINLQNIYSVPKGYFDGFAGQVISLIRKDENPAWLSSLPKESPYWVPAEYFEGLEERIMQAIQNHPDYQTSKEELQSISPLLNSLNKRPVYSVPDGYFENFKSEAEQEKSGARVISTAGRKWYRYAAAAVVAGIIALAGLMIYKNNHGKDGVDKTIARFEKEVKKIDDVKQTENLIDFMDAGLNEKELASNRKKIKTDDVQKLLQDVSTDELKDFNEQSKDIEDVMMTN